jgi:hypothetical protein
MSPDYSQEEVAVIHTLAVAAPRRGRDKMANTDLQCIYVQTFERNVRYPGPAAGSKLRQFCQFRGENSKQHNWERVGTLTATTKASRARPRRSTTRPSRGAPTRRSRSTRATSWSRKTSVQMLVDPPAPSRSRMGYALGRAMDDIIIAAATAAAGDGAGGTVAFAAGTYPATATAQTVGDGTSAITQDLIGLVTQRFMTNDIDAEVPKILVVGPVQVRQVAELDKATNSFYVNAKALAEHGMVKNWMGYTWLYSNRLTVPSAGVLDCLAFSEMALGLHVTKDIWARVAEDPSVSFALRVYSAFTGGAVRVEDEHIVDLRLLNS